MSRYKHVLFVCTRERSADAKSGSCARRGSTELLARMQQWIKAKGLKNEVRAVSSGCLSLCAKGCSAVVYSAGENHGQSTETWYTRLGPEQAEPLLEAHVGNNERFLGHVEDLSPGQPG